MEQKWQTEQGDKGETSAPKRSTASWSRPGKNGKKTGIPKTSVGVPIRNPNPPGKVPQGQYLSKTSTELSNDPLAEKAYFPAPASMLMASATREKIYSGANVLPALQNELYSQICAVNPSYTKSVPKCAHDYYIGVLTYVRLIKLHVLNGGHITPEENLVATRILDADFKVPKSLSLFLAGFGNTRIPTSREVYFSMIKPICVTGHVTNGETEVTIPGYFGAIMDNLGAYSSYPCLGVYAQRVLQDLVHPQNAPAPIEWDLPEELRAENKPINFNCLGYSPSVRLTAEHRAFLSGAGVSLDRFEFNSREVPVLYELMHAVQMKLLASRLTLHSVSSVVSGSVGQLVGELVYQQTTSRTVAAEFLAKTAIDMPVVEGFLGTSFLYNVVKDYGDLAVVKSLMPVRYRVNDSVTPEAKMGINALYHLTTDLVKQVGYESIPYSPGLRLGDIIKVDFGQ